MTTGESSWEPSIAERTIVLGGRFRTVDEVLEEVKPDIVHFNKIWDWPLHLAVKAVRKRGIPYYCTPRGSLEPWALGRKRLKKRLARALYQDRDLRLAAAIQVTSEEEAARIRELGFDNRIVLSPNGVEVRERIGRRYGEKRRALFLSRMHPGKGALDLVRSWAALKAAGDSSIGDWECEFVYSVRDDVERGCEAEVKAEAARLGVDDAMIFTGELRDDGKWAAYERAELFILPTVSENFGIAIAEALASGLPVITTEGAPWGELPEIGAGWRVKLPAAETLADAMK